MLRDSDIELLSKLTEHVLVYLDDVPSDLKDTVLAIINKQPFSKRAKFESELQEVISNRLGLMVDKIHPSSVILEATARDVYRAAIFTLEK